MQTLSESDMTVLLFAKSTLPLKGGSLFSLKYYFMYEIKRTNNLSLTSRGFVAQCLASLPAMPKVRVRIPAGAGVDRQTDRQAGRQTDRQTAS